MRPSSSLTKEQPEVRLGLAGRMARLFLENRHISTLTLIVLGLWGALSFVLMPKQYNPEIVAPAFVVASEFPGASAEETRELLTRRLEDAIAELPKVDEVSSQSFAGGRSVVMAKFLVGSDQEDATVALGQKLRDIRGSLPASASEPSIQSVSPDDVPVLDIGLSSDILSESSLRKLAIDLADELKLVPGISKAEVRGGRTNHLQVDLDAQALSAAGLTVTDAVEAISRANGSLSIESVQTEGRDATVAVSGSLAGTEELARTAIREDGGTLLRLEDVARVSYGPGEIRDFVRLSEKGETAEPVVHIALSKLKGENATTVSKQALEKLEELKSRSVPDDVSVSVLRDEGRTAGEEISKLTLDLVKSVLIVGALLALFLGLRNSLVASVSIPLVLLTVFGLGLLAGQTVNRITLFALILSLGLLVDDAIVVVENIARYFRLYPKENRSSAPSTR
jgi:multidrug efflux pump subunit AcrB